MALSDPHAVTVYVEDVEELFVAPSPRPFDEHPGYWPALEQTYRLIKPQRLNRPSRLVVVTPPGPADAELAARVRAAIGRWCDLHIAEARSEIAFHRREGAVKLLLGLAFLAICLGLRQAAEEASFLPDFFQVFLVEGLTIVGWVILWTPIGIFLYDWWPHRQDIAVYRYIAGMDVDLTAARPAPDASP